MRKKNYFYKIILFFLIFEILCQIFFLDTFGGKAFICQTINNEMNLH